MKKVFIGLAGLMLCLALTGCESKEKHECLPFVGGMFELNYNTNGGNEIEMMHVCVACAPSSYEALPVPEKEGYNFLGWYYDEAFEKQVEGESTLNVEHTERNTDEYGCETTYKPVTLYAKWGE